MKYISIDIETTGLNPEYCQVIEFAAVIDDLANPKPLHELPRFQTYVMHNIYVGEPFALAMHANTFKKLAKPSDYKDDEFVHNTNLLEEFRVFLTKNGYIYVNAPKLIVAGKNFQSFDRRFLDKLPGWGNISWHHRTLDPMMLYMQPGDAEPPSSLTCMERAGLHGIVAHTALEDALMVVQLLRRRLVSPKDVLFGLDQ